MLCSQLLRLAGAQVSTELGGENVVARVQELMPDIILMDVQLGTTTGFDLCNEIQSNAALRAIPIILMSGTSLATEDIVRGFRFGAVDYVLKPFQSPELCARLSSHIELARYREQYREFAMMLHTELDQQYQEYVYQKVQMNKAQGILQQFKQEIEQVLSIGNERDRIAKLRTISSALDEEIRDWDSWHTMEREFRKVHENYQQVLLQAYPKLSKTEIRVCMMIRLNHSSKAIAEMLQVGVPTVEIYRHRIRKKMGLHSEENFYTHLVRMLS